MAQLSSGRKLMDHPGDFEFLSRRIKETKGLRTRDAAENLLDQAIVAMVATSEQVAGAS